MNKYKICIVIFFLSIKFYAQCKDINQNDLKCNQAEFDDYLSYKIDVSKNVEILYKIDFCELLNSKTELKVELQSNFLILINGYSISLNTHKNYYNLMPTSIFKKTEYIYIVEFNLISHIGLTGYNYLYIDCKKKESIIIKEIDSKKKLSLKKLLKKINNTKGNVGNVKD